jgi:hypothetical protein
MSSAGAARAAMATADNPGQEAASPVGNGVQQGLAVIADYIPSEALATFLGLWGLATGLLHPTRQLFDGIVVVGFLAVPFFLAVGFNFNVRLFLFKFTLLLIFGLVAFAVWLLALPGGPWAGTLNVLGTDMPTETLGGGLVIILAGSMPKIASLLHLRE